MCLIAKIEGDAAEILSKFRFHANLEQIVLVENAVVLASEPLKQIKLFFLL